MAYLIKTGCKTYWKRQYSAFTGNSAGRLDATRFKTLKGAEKRAESIREYLRSTGRSSKAKYVEVEDDRLLAEYMGRSETEADAEAALIYG